MSHNRCSSCGLINYHEAQACRRCAQPLANSYGANSIESTEDSPPERYYILKRAGAVLGLVLFILVIWYASLLTTSQAINEEQELIVQEAVDLLADEGFTQEAFLLRHVANYRVTDNWWNQWLGHSRAYAAVNFPFEVVTLYPEFFTAAVDEVERAAILLHEAYHLYGYGEPMAFEGVWRNKSKLGWEAARYGQTRVWKNVREGTQIHVPQLFQCGLDRATDCIE